MVCDGMGVGDQIGDKTWNFLEKNLNNNYKISGSSEY